MAFVAPAHPFVKAARTTISRHSQSLISETDVNMRDKRSRTTALEHAVRNANREMVQFLLWPELIQMYETRTGKQC